MYESLTRPATVEDAAAAGSPRPLPALIEPDANAVVSRNVAEELVPVKHPRIVCLDAYWKAGWPEARRGTMLRKRAAAALGHAADALPAGFGLAVFDAWRPYELQRALFEDAYGDGHLPEGFVAPPSQSADRPSAHLTGGTVDVTLTRGGKPLGLGTGFDHFGDEARTAFYEGTDDPAAVLRRLLFWTMAEQGFVNLPCEWWHFSRGTRCWASVTGEEARYGPAGPPAMNATKPGKKAA